MDDKKIKSLLDYYERHLKRKYGFGADKAGMNSKLLTKETAFKYILFMITEIYTFLEVGSEKIGKVFRWLGFIQGVLWLAG